MTEPSWPEPELLEALRLHSIYGVNAVVIAKAIRDASVSLSAREAFFEKVLDHLIDIDDVVLERRS